MARGWRALLLFCEVCEEQAAAEATVQQQRCVGSQAEEGNGSVNILYALIICSAPAAAEIPASWVGDRGD